ncbi:MAG: hypothetical protein FJ290_14775 [Planctomycetes bacterium]|nr:hypothetical protein [Planctomycetota bacterium]
MTTTDTVRPGYQQQPAWTLAEAADFVGRSVSTICRWTRVPVEDVVHGQLTRQYRFRVWAVGAFRVDAATFKAFVRSRMPQGDVAQGAGP